MESIRRGTYGNFRLAPRRLRHDPARKYETTRREKRPGHDRTSIIQHTLPRKIENLFNRGDRATLKCSRAVPILFSHLSILFFPFLFYLFIFLFFSIRYLRYIVLWASAISSGSVFPWNRRELRRYFHRMNEMNEKNTPI